ncbi:hypothetical protein ACFUEN_29215 [Streptomyces griseorubiginosus]|uniref:hypothetical protein n=1 Tax=Streptomyces griseorubiginosus TaxID=67304 RepID=UPI00363CC3FA
MPQDFQVLAPQIRLDITEHLIGARSPQQVCRELDVTLADVTDILTGLGHGRIGLRRHLTIEQYFRSRVRHIDGGHLLWLDWVERGVPVLVHGGHVYCARTVAWRMAHSTDADRPVTPGCPVPLCVAPEHSVDRPTRRTLARIVHDLFGDQPS